MKTDTAFLYMLYSSTRGGINAVPFKKAVMMGLARDGGLLLPESFPNASEKLEAWSHLCYQDLAFEIISCYANDIPSEALRDIINRSYATFRDEAITPIKKVGPVHILELFHGPTLAFKDVALQFLGNLFEYILGETDDILNIVVATSGDTGSAAIQGVRGRKHMRIFILHPDGRVSRVQEMQMTSVLDDNVFNIALEGTFDDAQAIVKELFGDLEFKDTYKLGAVNSINWARILAQVVYYFFAAFRVMEQTGSKQVSFSVPTGNFGDVFAGYVAAMMGLPINKLILATNENDILSRFFQTGIYSKGKVVPTLSPSMDIQIASNFERWLFLHAERNAETLKTWMDEFAKGGTIKIPNKPGTSELDPILRASRAETAQTLSTISTFYTSYDYLLDPHTAVGISAGLENVTDGIPMICLATAHPAKFPDAIERATAHAELATAPEVEALKGLPTRKTKLPNRCDAIAAFVAARIPLP